MDEHDVEDDPYEALRSIRGLSAEAIHKVGREGRPSKRDPRILAALKAINELSRKAMRRAEEVET